MMGNNQKDDNKIIAMNDNGEQSNKTIMNKLKDSIKGRKVLFRGNTGKSRCFNFLKEGLRKNLITREQVSPQVVDPPPQAREQVYPQVVDPPPQRREQVYPQAVDPPPQGKDQVSPQVVDPPPKAREQVYQQVVDPPSQAVSPSPQVVIVPPQVGYPQPMILGEYPVAVTCFYCKNQVQTIVLDKGPRDIAWILCIATCFVPGVCCLAPVWLCIPSFRSYSHSCPRCNAFIGSSRQTC